MTMLTRPDNTQFAANIIKKYESFGVSTWPEPALVYREEENTTRAPLQNIYHQLTAKLNFLFETSMKNEMSVVWNRQLLQDVIRHALPGIQEKTILQVEKHFERESRSLRNTFQIVRNVNQWSMEERREFIRLIRETYGKESAEETESKLLAQQKINHRELQSLFREIESVYPHQMHLLTESILKTVQKNPRSSSSAKLPPEQVSHREPGQELRHPVYSHSTTFVFRKRQGDQVLHTEHRTLNMGQTGRQQPEQMHLHTVSERQQPEDMHSLSTQQPEQMQRHTISVWQQSEHIHRHTVSERQQSEQTHRHTVSERQQPERRSSSSYVSKEVRQTRFDFPDHGTDRQREERQREERKSEKTSIQAQERNLVTGEAEKIYLSSERERISEENRRTSGRRRAFSGTERMPANPNLRQSAAEKSLVSGTTPADYSPLRQPGRNPSPEFREPLQSHLVMRDRNPVPVPGENSDKAIHSADAHPQNSHPDPPAVANSPDPLTVLHHRNPPAVANSPDAQRISDHRNPSMEVNHPDSRTVLNRSNPRTVLNHPSAQMPLNHPNAQTILNHPNSQTIPNHLNDITVLHTQDARMVRNFPDISADQTSSNPLTVLRNPASSTLLQHADATTEADRTAMAGPLLHRQPANGNTGLEPMAKEIQKLEQRVTVQEKLVTGMTKEKTGRTEKEEVSRTVKEVTGQVMKTLEKEMRLERMRRGLL